jgi:hypothetical protein
VVEQAAIEVGKDQSHGCFCPMPVRWRTKLEISALFLIPITCPGAWSAFISEVKSLFYLGGCRKHAKYRIEL